MSSSITVRILLLIGEVAGTLWPRKTGKPLFFFFPFYQIGGAEKVHADIVAAVADQHPHVFFTNSSKDSQFKPLFEKNARLTDLSPFVDHRFAHYVCLGALASFINKHPGAVVFGSNNVLFYQLLSRLKESVRRIDLVHAFGGGIEHVSLPHVDLIDTRIVINARTLLDLKTQYATAGLDLQLLDRIVMIGNQVRVPVEYPVKNEGGGLTVLYVGRESEEKRIHLAIEAARRCQQSGIPASFIFVGDIKRRTLDEPLDNSTFTGEIADQAQLSALYAKAHALVLTSSSEGFPMVVMEAMAHGAVPISTDVGGISSHVKHNFNGLLIPPRSEEEVVDSLVASLTRLAEDPLLLKQLSINAYEYAREHFAPQKFRLAYRRLIVGAGGEAT